MKGEERKGEGVNKSQRLIGLMRLKGYIDRGSKRERGGEGVRDREHRGAGLIKCLITLIWGSQHKLESVLYVYFKESQSVHK